MRWVVIVVALAGCNGAFDLDETQLDTRPDLDHDRIPDEEDDCIAAPDDDAFDSDGDGILNRDDSCAMLFNLGVDSDSDGVDDVCDAFPTVAGDRPRCANAFRDRVLTVSFFASRLEQEFAVARGFIILPPDSDAIAAEPLIATTGTSIFDALTSSVADDQPYAIALAVSVGDTANKTTDVGCLVIASLTETTIYIAGGSQRFATPPGPARGNDPIYVRAIAQPGKVGDNLLCGASYGSDSSVAAIGHFDGDIRRQGFSVAGGGAAVASYTIVERDDQPNLF